MFKIVLFSVLVLLAGCTDSTRPEPNAPTAQVSRHDERKAVGTCPEGESAEEYGCSGFCPNMENDVREEPGFHVVGTVVDDKGHKLIHVADTCQHFFCAIDEDCVKAGGSETACMRPTGCLLVHKLKK